MKKWYFLVPVVIFLAGVLLLLNRQNSFSTQIPEASNEVLPVSNTTKVEYECEKDKTAFELLEEKNQIQASESDFGKFVVTINGVEQGEGKYWLYSVDDKEATVSATGYVCQGQEKIKWELK